MSAIKKILDDASGTKFQDMIANSGPMFAKDHNELEEQMLDKLGISCWEEAEKGLYIANEKG